MGLISVVLGERRKAETYESGEDERGHASAEPTGEDAGAGERHGELVGASPSEDVAESAV